jgi:hypothetical protein
MVGAVVLAALGARYVWLRTRSADAGLAASMLLGALLVGAVAFCPGFFGPIFLMPHANQGPLLGLFITGPLGFVAGAVGGALYWLVRNRRSRATTT